MLAYLRSCQNNRLQQLRHFNQTRPKALLPLRREAGNGGRWLLGGTVSGKQTTTTTKTFAIEPCKYKLQP